MKILVTGTAGFIGFHLAKRLLERGDEVVGLDNINDYYDVNLKYGRLEETGIPREKVEYNRLVSSTKYPNYRFIKLNLEDRENLHRLMEREKFDKVCHLGAQAGVRYSLQNPYAYLNSNLVGHLNILEGVRHFGTQGLTYASSSSVYGLNRKQPFDVDDNVDHPISLYAATKKSNELMSHTYSYLYNIPTTGLRFFTVYGPWGRPDMALFKFVKGILEGREIEVYNYGKMERDFTYIDDIIEGVVRVIDNPAQPNPHWKGEPGSSPAPYRVYNIGRGSPVKLMDFIETIEKVVGKKAKKKLMPMQPGDVPSTYADTTALERDFGYKPKVSVEEGVAKFVEWYRNYYGV
ncbi:MAG: NAD-dependent epimerase [Epsilonproteobacteria bacterium]|jgi:UDP-glucuronate 4-epimerase|nr:NAD-dependent epimerase [Campylobacterota bacterium]NPA89046.1 NAD-dependent epimerase [Campylobacterota bacterium]